MEELFSAMVGMILGLFLGALLIVLPEEVVILRQDEVTKTAIVTYKERLYRLELLEIEEKKP